MTRRKLRPIEVGPQDVQETLGGVHITSPELVAGLIKSPEQTLDLLRDRLGPIDLDQIDIDRSGRLVIKDATLARRVRDVMNLPEAAGNNICGLGC